MINNPEYKKILQACLDTWGDEIQFQMAIGECGEFTTLAGRKVQGRMSEEDLIDEVADVTMMMAQMSLMIGDGKVEAHIKKKMEKLSKRLEKYRNK